ncbi:MAG: hypothetical protein AAGI11_06755 [Pseudomonadota bacterium]
MPSDWNKSGLRALAFSTLSLSIGLTLASSNAHAVTAVYGVDDGSASGNVMDTGVGCGVTNANTLEWGNIFVTNGGTETITDIQVAFGESEGDNLNGVTATVRLYDDPNNDRDPNDIGAPLATATGPIANYNSDTFNTFDIVDTPVNGIFFVAVSVDIPASAGQIGAFPARIDDSSNQGFSWARNDCSNTGSFGNWSNIFFDGAENFMVRAGASQIATGITSVALGANVGDAAPTQQVTIDAVENLTGISCGFVESLTGNALLSDPTALSVDDSSLPTSVLSGNSLVLDFSCSTGVGLFEQADYRCATNEGNITVPALCNINAAAISPNPTVIQAFQNQSSPAVNVTFTAATQDLTNISCGYVSGTPAVVQLTEGLDATILSGNSDTITLQCNTANVAEETAFYACQSDQGTFIHTQTCQVIAAQQGSSAPVNVTPPPPFFLLKGDAAPPPMFAALEVTSQAPVTNVACDWVQRGTSSSVTPTVLSAVAPPSSLPGEDTTNVEFNCATTTSTFEELDYLCGSDQGEIRIPALCAVAGLVLTPEGSTELMGKRLGPAPSVDIDVASGNEALTNVLCGLTTDFLTFSQTIGNLTIDQNVPGSIALGASETLGITCSTSEASDALAGVFLSCASDQGFGSAPVSCSVRERFPVEPSVDVLELDNQSNGGEGTIDFVADGAPVTGITNCGFVDLAQQGIVPTTIQLLSGTVPSSLGATENFELGFSCSGAPGFEQVIYGCLSDQGVFGAQINCSTAPVVDAVITEPAPIEANVGEANATTTSTVTPNEDFNIVGCAFIDENLVPLPTTERLFVDTGISGNILAANGPVDVVFGCNTSTAGTETLAFGCATDKGSLGPIDVSCEVTETLAAPVVVSGPQEIFGVKGQGIRQESAELQVTSPSAVTNIACGWVEPNTTTPVTPTLLSASTPPISLPGTSSTLQGFQCDTAVSGFETQDYRCTSDQGEYRIPVSCFIDGFNVVPQSLSILNGKVQGTPPNVDFSVAPGDEALSNLVCDLTTDFQTFSSTIGNLTIDQNVPTSIALGASETLSLSCSTSEAFESPQPLFVACASDQGVSRFPVSCNIRERFPVEPTVDVLDLAGLINGGNGTVELVADGAPVTGITNCGFVDLELQPVVPSTIQLVSGTVPSSLGATESVELGFSCGGAVGFEQVVYGCESDQGSFGVQVDCIVSNVLDVVITEPAPIEASVGQANATTTSTLTPNVDFNVAGCGFVDQGGALIVTERLSVQSGIAGSILAADGPIQLVFACDTATAGSEAAPWGCITDLGVLGPITVSCDVTEDEGLCPDGSCAFLRGWRLAIPDLVKEEPVNTQ